MNYAYGHMKYNMQTEHWKESKGILISPSHPIQYTIVELIFTLLSFSQPLDLGSMYCAFLCFFP